MDLPAYLTCDKQNRNRCWNLNSLNVVYLIDKTSCILVQDVFLYMKDFTVTCDLFVNWKKIVDEMFRFLIKCKYSG